MRIYLNTTPNSQPVPIDYQQKLVGTIHKWIGRNNNVHGDISLYSFSWLKGSKLDSNYLSFKRGANFFISFYDENVIKSIIRTILDNPKMFCGLEVTDVQIAEMPYLSDRTLFYCGSPVFIKRRLPDGHIRQYNFNDAESASLMKETLISKMRMAGLEADDSLDIKFDTSYSGKCLKLIHYHGIGNKASLCPVIIHGKEETKRFAWDVGIGSCTGIGFGAIY